VNWWPQHALITAHRTCWQCRHASRDSALPQLRRQQAADKPSRVVVAAPAYAEHAHRWQQAGHAVREIDYPHLAQAIDTCDVMVVCNPNNPTGAGVAPGVLLDWAARLAARGGWLVVDEAFGDTLPLQSVAAHAEMAGLIVLRSVGKFSAWPFASRICCRQSDTARRLA